MLAISTAYWPLVWPSPAPAAVHVLTGASRLTLPVRAPHPGDAHLRAFGPAEGAPLPAYQELRPPRVERRTERDARSGETRLEIVAEGGAFRAGGPGRLDAIALELSEEMRRRYVIRDGDPLSARAHVEQRMALRRDGWAVHVETSASLAATGDRFALEVGLDAFEDETRVAARRWRVVVPRDTV